MSKFVSAIAVILLMFSLVACGNQATAQITPYQTAKEFQPDATTADSFKNAVKGVKAATLKTYTVTGVAADIKTYYDNQFSAAGWTSRDALIADVARQQTNQSGWSIAYEKGSDVATLTLTPGTVASATFPNVTGSDNLLVLISATK